MLGGDFVGQYTEQMVLSKDQFSNKQGYVNRQSLTMCVEGLIVEPAR